MLEGTSDRYLLPYYMQKAGVIIFIIGVAALYVRFGLGIKPDWLEIKVFAFHSAIFETRYFAFVSNNVSEEIGMLLTDLGLFLLTLSKEKKESKILWALRAKSFIFSVYAYACLFLLCVIFIYGWGFMAFMGLSLFLPLICYNVIFRFLLYKQNHIRV